MTRRLPLLAFAAAAVCSSLAAAQSLAAAKAAAREGRVDAAISALKGVTPTADSHELLCDLYRSTEQVDSAISECEAAANGAPANSSYQLNLARAYGAKASHSGAFTGMRMVGKIRSAFERSVELDGRNIDALSDLGQFYVEAPGIVGGGSDKAQALVDRLKPFSEARSHRLAAMIAARNKDYGTAEREYNAAVSAAHSPESYVDLANFYRDRKQLDRAAENAGLALKADTHHGPDTLDTASLLINLKRYPAAIAALRSYLTAHQTTDVADFAKAHTLLGNALAATGDNAAAQSEYNAALALARNYDPARKALKQ